MKSDDLQVLMLNNDDFDSVHSKLNKILSIIRKHLDMDVAFISEFKDGKRVFKFIDVDNDFSSLKVGDSDPLEDTYCQKIADNSLSHIIENTRDNDITNAMPITDKLSIGSYMGVPIVLSNGETFGTFCCFKESSDHTLNNRDLAFLNAISDIASSLIERNIKFEHDHKEIEERIQSVLQQDTIDIHYQPIYNLMTDKLSGFESLSRFMTTPYRSPDVWFREASQVGLGEELEVLAIKSALNGLAQFPSHLYISINTSPAYILNGAISKVLQGIDLKRVVLEVTEHSPISSYEDFRQALAPLRKQGVRLAIDDAGAGYASFQHILELEPDIIKLDISLTQNIQDNRTRFLLARALCGFSKAIDCVVVAEGIETVQELTTLKELGVNMVQGYLLGKPMPMDKAMALLDDDDI